MSCPSTSDCSATEPLSTNEPRRTWFVFKGVAARHATLLCALVWLALGVTGLVILFLYENSPGSTGDAPASWPGDTTIEPSGHDATLVMFVHPQCPCTRASLGELEKIVAHYQGKVTPWVVFFRPKHMADGWERTDLWNTAAAIPGAHVVADLDGVEAHRFHATTSGQTLLYSPSGDLVFSGGITSSRGHSGDNAGRDAVESYLTSGQASPSSTPVFGCSFVTSTKTQ